MAMDVADPDPGFSRQAWSGNAGLYEAIRTMPFNAELAAGVLSDARFRHYITQDAHYLVGFGRALALAAAKAPTPDRIVQFAKAAEVAIVVERAPLCCTGRGRGRTGPYPVRGQAMRTDSGRPSSSMRLSAWTPTLTSVARRRSVRECSPSPITRL